MTSVSALCTVLGAAAVLLWGDADWGPTRRVLAGAIGGLFVAIIIITTRMLGAFGKPSWEEEDDRSKASPGER